MFLIAIILACWWWRSFLLTYMDFLIYNSIDSVKSLWLEFDKEVSDSQKSKAKYRSDYSFYQTFLWNEFFEKTYRSKLTFKLGLKRFKYVVACDDYQPVAILPIAISRLSRKIEFPSWKIAGLNNIVFSPRCSKKDDVANGVLQYIKHRYQGWRFSFFDIPKSSPLSTVLYAFDGVRFWDREGYHAELSCRHSYSEYQQYLSKSLRQTLRTARNHFSRIGNYKFVIYSNEADIPNGLLRKVWQLYYKRRKEWRKRSYWEYNPLTIRFKAFMSSRGILSIAVKKLKQAKLAALEVNGRPIAFAIFFVADGMISVPRLAIDSKYRKFSPGFILVDEMIQWAFQNGITDFDLGKGEEPYKKRVGCVGVPIVRFWGRF